MSPENEPQPRVAMNRTLITLLGISLVIQTLIGLSILTGILVGAYWLSTAIEGLNIEAVSLVIDHVLHTSVNIERLSHDALGAVHAASLALNQTTVSLQRLNDVLRHPTVSLSLPGLSTP